MYPEEIVIADESITIELDYPLSKSFYFRKTRKGGFTRRVLLETIRELYLQVIYRSIF